MNITPTLKDSRWICLRNRRSINQPLIEMHGGFLQTITPGADQKKKGRKGGVSESGSQGSTVSVGAAATSRKLSLQHRKSALFMMASAVRTSSF